jgi:tRNA-dihydrouridine synthase B
VSIPVFANGDIDTPETAAAVLAQTGADGVMIGRAAQGNPWIFREVSHYLLHGEELAPPGPAEVLDVMERHLAALRQAYGPDLGVRVARKHISWYLDGRTDARETRNRLMRVEQAEEQVGLLRAYFRQQESARQVSTKPGQLAA